MKTVVYLCDQKKKCKGSPACGRSARTPKILLMRRMESHSMQRTILASRNTIATGGKRRRKHDR